MRRLLVLLHARVAGNVKRVHVDIGTPVKGPRRDAAGKLVEPGTLLLEIDVPELEQEARQKEVLVRQAMAEVEQARKNLISAEAILAASETLVVEARAGLKRAQGNYERWESESNRVAELVRRQVIDAQTRDETNSQFRSAESAREEAQARVLSAQAQARHYAADKDRAAVDIQVAEARQEVARAEADRLRTLVGFANIRAPSTSPISPMGPPSSRNLDRWNCHAHRDLPALTHSTRRAKIPPSWQSSGTFIDKPGHLRPRPAFSPSCGGAGFFSTASNP